MNEDCKMQNSERYYIGAGAIGTLSSRAADAQIGGTERARRVVEEQAKQYAANQTQRPESELEALASRIRRVTAAIDGIADNLRAHADRAFGPLAKLEGTGCDPLMRSGQIGMICEALDHLEAAQAELAQQAARNTTLA